MSHVTCIASPANSRFINVHEWQIKFCHDNHCAALLLAFFIAWHDWKTQNDQYYRRANDIAEMHGDGRPHNQNAYLFFSMEELIAGCMGFYSKNAINEALQLLVSMDVITIHKNPNPRYHFDKTKYFQFSPAVCNSWIADNYPIETKSQPIVNQLIDYSDTPKSANRFSENKRRSAELGQPSNEIGKAITDTTNNTTNKDHSINACDDFVDQNETRKDEGRAKAQTIIDALTEQGLSAKHFNYPDTIQTIQRLCDAGASVGVFIDAYAMAKRTSSSGFGVNYLAKIVEDLLNKKINTPRQNSNIKNSERKPNYEADYSKGLDWMGELID